MEHVVLVVHLIVAFVMIILVMLQRSEGGGLGLGSGGGGLGNFASVQSTASALTKITTYVAIAFFCTSIVLAILASNHGATKASILDNLAAEKEVAVPVGEPANDSAEKAVEKESAAPADDKPAAEKEKTGEAPKVAEPPTVPIAK
ncbi:MAG: preprotein translocase subunit SecG [Pseudobdellovibrionaceae bacterium]